MEFVRVAELSGNGVEMQMMSAASVLCRVAARQKTVAIPLQGGLKPNNMYAGGEGLDVSTECAANLLTPERPLDARSPPLVRW